MAVRGGSHHTASSSAPPSSADEMATRPDRDRTLVVSHWGFILSLTGRSVANGEWLRFDPTHPPPTEIVWRH